MNGNILPYYSKLTPDERDFLINFFTRIEAPHSTFSTLRSAANIQWVTARTLPFISRNKCIRALRGYYRIGSRMVTNDHIIRDILLKLDSPVRLKGKCAVQL